MAKSTVVDWPALNSRVWLRLPCCGAEHPTRVEDFAEKACTVAAPSLPHKDVVDVDTVSQGFFLGWVTGSKALEAPVKLAGFANDKVPTWTVEAVGDPAETQRRSYVRLQIDMSIDLQLLINGAPTRARTIDVSEGGIKCEVDEMALDPGQRLFNVTLHLPDKTFVLPSQMVWWGNMDGKTRSIGLRFVGTPPKTADAIRQFIFSTQLEQRRRQNA